MWVNKVSLSFPISCIFVHLKWFDSWTCIVNRVPDENRCSFVGSDPRGARGLWRLVQTGLSQGFSQEDEQQCQISHFGKARVVTKFVATEVVLLALFSHRFEADCKILDGLQNTRVFPLWLREVIVYGQLRFCNRSEVINSRHSRQNRRKWSIIFQLTGCSSNPNPHVSSWSLVLLLTWIWIPHSKSLRQSSKMDVGQLNSF